MKDNNVSELLITLRKQHGYTQTDLADKLGVSFQAVSKWERGENLPDAYTLVDLANIYNITVDEILKGKLIERDTISKIGKRKKALTILGIFIIMISPVSIFLFDLEDFTTYVPVLLVTVAIGVGMLIYATVSSEQLVHATPKKREHKRNEEIVYAICAGIFLIAGLVYGMFHIAWVVFIFGYAITLIINKEQE